MGNLLPNATNLKHLISHSITKMIRYVKFSKTMKIIKQTNTNI